MGSIDKFINNPDVVYCKTNDNDYGFGDGCGGFYFHRIRCHNTYKYKGNGIIGSDAYGKGTGYMQGYGDGAADLLNLVNDNKGYGQPHIKD